MSEVLLETYYIILPIVTTACMTWIAKELNNQKKERSANTKGTMLGLRELLDRYYALYSLQGYVTDSQYKNFEEVYNAYHDLHGNSFATKMWEEVKKLPIRSDEEGTVSPYGVYVFKYVADMIEKKRS